MKAILFTYVNYANAMGLKMKAILFIDVNF